VAARLVSRHRELAADRGAATLTGSPAAVAATLRSLTDRLDSMRRLDLRLAADLEMLNFLPAASGRAEGIWATHPPLARRLAQLDRMERELQADR
jgi:heat shock protein HtpX